MVSGGRGLSIEGPLYLYIYIVHESTCICMQTNLSIEEGGDTVEEIAQRTRSKCPLHDVSITSLEAGLSTVEGEDPPTPRELDPDELWWHQGLNSLTTDTLSGTPCRSGFMHVYTEIVHVHNVQYAYGNPVSESII